MGAISTPPQTQNLMGATVIPNASANSIAFEDKFGLLSFVYGTNGDFEFAESFLYKMYSTYGEDRISIQISKQQKYLEYLNAVKKFNAKLLKTATSDGYLVKIYQGATTTFIFKTGTSSNNLGDTKSMWILSIWSNEDFNSQL